MEQMQVQTLSMSVWRMVKKQQAQRYGNPGGLEQVYQRNQRKGYRRMLLEDKEEPQREDKEVP
jgi:hypothetical protein